jgi:uncharacterized membrane protein YphA (DoxX/SURF4 family)
MMGPEASAISSASSTELMPNSSALLPTIAAVRVATSVFFLPFGEYKVAGPGFARGGFQSYLRDSIAPSAVSFYRPVLAGLVVPRAIFFGYVVGAGELLAGVSLFAGLWVRPACIPGILFLLNMLLATWGTGPRSSGLALFRCRTRPSSPVAAADHSVCRRCWNGLGAGRAPRVHFIAVAVES